MGFLSVTEQSFVYFGVLRIEYQYVLMIFCMVLIIYYLIWKYLVAFLNHELGIAG